MEIVNYVLSVLHEEIRGMETSQGTMVKDHRFCGE